MEKNSAEKWKIIISKYKKQCQNILKISKNVRYAGVINLYGRTLTGIVNPKLKPLLKSEEIRNEFFIMSTLMTLRKDSINSVGKLEHAILQHQKICSRLHNDLKNKDSVQKLVNEIPDKTLQDDLRIILKSV